MVYGLIKAAKTMDELDQLMKQDYTVSTWMTWMNEVWSAALRIGYKYLL